ncbi:hypothetical protein CDL12_02585 [Handroanthus impetiginosus]|uniref:Cyclin-dependent kinase inhibitor n=1 Tax=Handroanthus impetiginosus TaxID=429701 RepID=A0A2G9I4K5_9LAMI|nr:hypothetical protein CDL12_12069 [Handroanthus impetiginosus]PIN24686.1 hypothetical protein CDL12_02585 [Handroanthus impetiginosus]
MYRLEGEMEEYMKRSESLAMKSRGMQLICSKKRKFYSDFENEYGGDVEVVENSASPAVSRTSGCSKHEEYSSDVVKKSLRSADLENVDLQSEGFEQEISTSVGDVFSREATPTSELYGDSEQVLVYSSTFTPKKKSSSPPEIPRRKIPASIEENMPSAAELEEFFAAAEKYEQNRFAEKYNYDIVKDVPLEGKYQWVRLKP